MDAAVRSCEFTVRHVGFDGASAGGGAVIKVLHQYHQFTVRRVQWRFTLGLMGAAGGGGGHGAGELVGQEVIRRSARPPERGDDFRLRRQGVDLYQTSCDQRPLQ